VSLRVGVDLVAVDAVRDAVEVHADRYLARVYTERELADCSTESGVAPERLAARFAAKEAALKVLRRGDDAVAWRCIEVVRDESGWVHLALSGRAAALADEAGVAELALSLSHEGQYAVAVVVAEVDGGRGHGGA
jgi:holo-[acyl-carrier protein] synthase